MTIDISKLASEILATSKNDLEKEYKKLKKKNIRSLNLNELQTILAYEMWKDGMSWRDVGEILSGKNPLYNTEKEIMNFLKTVFGY